MIEHSSGLRRGLINARQQETDMRLRHAHPSPRPNRRRLPRALLTAYAVAVVLFVSSLVQFFTTGSNVLGIAFAAYTMLIVIVCNVVLGLRLIRTFQRR